MFSHIDIIWWTGNQLSASWSLNNQFHFCIMTTLLFFEGNIGKKKYVAYIFLDLYLTR